MKNTNKDKKITKLEEMANFFDQRADAYDQHMKGVVKSFDDFYSSISKPIEKTKKEIKVLDLGCGTGLEIKWIFEKVPNSLITGVDMSENMLKLLVEKYKNYANQIKVIKDSYITLAFEEKFYDYVVSVMTMHHLLYKDKLKLYKKIWRCLKPGGKYIEGDYIDSPKNEKKWLDEYLRLMKEKEFNFNNQYHYDIPCSIPTEKKLFREAGFRDFKIVWKEDKAAIYSVTK